VKLLTICIPTYNRSLYVIKQLEYLKKEINGYKDYVSIIVADNHSEIEHREQLIQYHNENVFFELKLNETNLGLIGNLYYLSSISNSQYIWFVGDDDILLEGLLDKVYFILNQNENCYIFLNHIGFRDNPDNIVMKMDLSGYNTFYTNGKPIIIDIVRKYSTITMFITANIFPLHCITELSKCQRINNMADPLLFSFYAASKYPLYIVKDVYILDKYSDISWANESRKVFSIGVPSIICELNRFGYDKDEVKCILFNYFKKEQKIIDCLRRANQELINAIVFFLGYFNTLKLCIITLFFLIYRRIIDYWRKIYLFYILKTFKRVQNIS
jgi:hypothetical protein